MDHVIRGRQVDPRAPRLQGDQEDLALAGLEALAQTPPPPRGRRPRQVTTARTRAVHPPADQRPRAAPGHREGPPERAEKGAGLAGASAREGAGAAADDLAQELDPSPVGGAANIMDGEGATQVGLEAGPGLERERALDDERGRKARIAGEGGAL